jgi:hypothetical protein
MIKRILATTGTLALAGGLSAGLASQASASVHSVPVQGGGGVWANADFWGTASLTLTGSHVVTPGAVAIPASVGPPPVAAVPAVPGVTTYYYSMTVRDNGVFAPLPFALVPNQSGRYLDRRLPGRMQSGTLSGFATYTFSVTVTGTTANPVPVAPVTTNVIRVIDVASPLFAAFSPVLVTGQTYTSTAPVEGNFDTVYTASSVSWTYVPGYWRVSVPGYWRHVKAIKGRHGHKAYNKWILPVMIKVPGRWVSHPVTQRWDDASWNDNGQSYSAGNITGFAGLYHR